MHVLGYILAFWGAAITPAFSNQDLFAVQRQPQGVRIEISPFYQWLFGSTRVDEFDQEGSQLSFSKDLKISPTLGFQGSVSTRVSRWFFQLQGFWFPFRGGATQDYPIRYDEGILPSSLPFQVEGSFSQIQLKGGYTYSFFQNSLSFTPHVAIEYTNFTFGLKSRAGPSSSEYYGQFLPYLVFGFSLEKEWQRASLSLSSEGIFFENLSTFQNEGGVLKMSIAEFRFRLRFTFFISSFAAWFLEGRLWYFHGRLHSSREDDNRFHLWAPGIHLGLVIGI